MAKRKLDIFLGMDNAELKTKLEESTSLLKNLQTKVAGVLGGAAIGVSIKNMGDFAINASKNFEQAQISFSKMLQSEKEGAKLVKDIQDLANATPMTSASLNDNAKLLLNFNAVAADEVIPTLKMLGDITGGDKQRMDSLTLAFAQSASAGRLMGQDLLQMINAGFNPLQIMAEKTGKSVGQLKDEMSKGKITTDMVIQAFKDATEAGGKFAGMMEAQAQSKAGLEATKADSLEILARTISDKAMPALKELDKTEIQLINDTTAAVNKMDEWAQANTQTMNVVTNAGLALATMVLGYKSLTAVVGTLSTVHMQAIAAIKATEAAQIEAVVAAKAAEEAELALYYARLKGDQAMIKECVALKASTAAKATEAAASAKATQATVLQYAATGNFSQALKLATVQVKAFTASLLANPFTWIAVAIAGVTTAVFAYKNSLEETGKALDDINTKYEQQNRQIEDNISTINRLADAKKRTVAQEKELNDAIDALVKAYPGILSEYDREIIKLQGINKELAKKIYLTTQAAKVEDLRKQKEKIDKKVNSQHRSYVTNNAISAARFGTEIDTSAGRTGVRKSVQRDQDRINKELKEAEELLKKIENNEVSFGTSEERKTTRPKTSAPGMSDADKRKAARAAEKARKEAIALKQAQIDAELLKVRKNSEEEYKLELRKIDAKIALEKKGTAKYQEALNERTRLVQKHIEEVGQAELTAYNNRVSLQNLEMEREKDALERDKERGGVSNEEYYNKLLEFEEKKYNLKLAGLNREAELYKNDVRKYEEIQQEKLILTAEYETEKQKLVNESIEAESKQWKDLLSDIGDSFSDSLEDFLQGNATLKDSFISIFGDIKAAFVKMIAEMILEQAKLKMVQGVTKMSSAGGWIGTAANFIKGFFADGGIVPGNYNQPMPIVAHGSEMVLNPLQQKNLWNMIATAQGSQTGGAMTSNNGQQPVIMNNITPVFQSLDPAQGQKMFTDWMKQSGLPIVRDSIKNNNYQMRDIVKGV